MFSDLQVYVTPQFQHAQMVLSLLQLALKKAGYTVEAARLQGLDLTSVDMAKGALLVLQAMNVPIKDVQQTRSLAIQAVNDALKSAPASSYYVHN